MSPPLIPDYLQEAFTFIMVLSMYAIADLIQVESGLLVVTMMGIVLANQQLYLYLKIHELCIFEYLPLCSPIKLTQPAGRECSLSEYVTLN